VEQIGSLMIDSSVNYKCGCRNAFGSRPTRSGISSHFTGLVGNSDARTIQPYNGQDLDRQVPRSMTSAIMVVSPL